MTNVINDTVPEATVTIDGRFKVGQTYKKTDFSYANYNLFEIADRDGNDTISQEEIRRYNSPILFESWYGTEFFNEEKIKGYEDGKTYVMYRMKPAEDKQDYYAGLKRENVMETKKFLKRFDVIDCDKDGVISEKEMKDVEEIRKRTSEDISFLHKLKTLGAGVSVGGLLLGGLLGEFTLASKFSNKPKLANLIMSSCWVIGALIADIPFRFAVRKLNKEHDKNLGEYKEHAYAKAYWNDHSKTTGIWQIFTN